MTCAASRRRLHAARARLARLDRPRRYSRRIRRNAGVINENTPHYDLEPLYHDGKAQLSAGAGVPASRSARGGGAPLGRRHPGRPLSQQQAAAVPLTLRVGDG